jgi:ech hydrogenase subunit D
MSPNEQTLEVIPLDALLDQVRAMHQQEARLVQIGATRLPEQIELTYSFDLPGRLASLRVLVAPTTHVPSISSIYWCAFLYENEIHDLFEVPFDGIAIDFKGNLYRTTVKYAFGSTKPPAARAAAPAPAPQPSTH